MGSEEEWVSAPLVRDYRSLRQGLSRRDRSLREKVMSLHDAATLVQDGMSVGVGGSTMSRTPMAIIWELMRQRRKHLSCSRSIVSTDGDLLFGSDMADEVVTSWFAQGILWGLSKVMRHHVEKGGKRFHEWSHMAMGMRYRAGAMGVPFLPIRSMLGSDVARLRPEAKEFDCPFTGEKLLLVPALNPDVALIHVQRCDAFGNAQMDGLQFMDIDLAMAADRVILTTERLVSNEQVRSAPHECYGLYEPMMGHMEAYVAKVNRSPVEGMREHLERYFYGPESWTDYLSLIGMAELLEASQRGRSIYND